MAVDYLRNGHNVTISVFCWLPTPFPIPDVHAVERFISICELPIRSSDRDVVSLESGGIPCTRTSCVIGNYNGCSADTGQAVVKYYVKRQNSRL